MVVITSGDNRRVIAIPSLGIVFKIARVYWRYAFGNFFYALRMHRPRGKFGEWCRRQWYEFSFETYSSLKRLLFGGIYINWSEWRFYQDHPDLRPILQPTYFSLFGLVNVQLYGVPMSEKDGMPMYHAFFPIAGQDLVRDGHHWTEAENFHLTPSGPRILDYGGSRTRRIIEKYGLALKEKFDLSYGRAKYEYFRSKRAQ